MEKCREPPREIHMQHLSLGHGQPFSLAMVFRKCTMLHQDRIYMKNNISDLGKSKHFCTGINLSYSERVFFNYLHKHGAAGRETFCDQPASDPSPLGMVSKRQWPQVSQCWESLSVPTHGMDLPKPGDNTQVLVTPSLIIICQPI